jgi:hypothetical protein
MEAMKEQYEFNKMKLELEDLESKIVDLEVNEIGGEKGYVQTIKGARRIIAQGDIHGDLDGLLVHLKAAGVIDESNEIILKKGDVVAFAGDYVDRGTQNLEVIKVTMIEYINHCLGEH